MLRNEVTMPITKMRFKKTPLKKKRTLLKKKIAKPIVPDRPLTLEESVAKSITTIKNNDYKGTFIKVELEANMSRRWDDSQCKEWIERNVSQEARDALIFSMFYNDGSVDSEYTFTVPIDKPYVVCEFIEKFKEMQGEGAGSLFDTTGAGMHIAILNSRDGNYPRGNSLNNTCQGNFAASVQSLLPALYFLGSSNATSRSLSFRVPSVCAGHKYNAINSVPGVFEYRLFDTCYDKPKTFLDYFCVIAKTMQFYKKEQVKMPFFGTIGELSLPDAGYHLSRFYTTTKHLEALDLGLAIIKPDHKTISQLKKERNFTIDPTTLQENDNKLTLRLKAEYPSAKKLQDIAGKAQFIRLNQKADMDVRDGYLSQIDRNLWVKIQMENWKIERGLENEESYISKKKQELLASSGKLYTVNV